jgi:hypothetical protein
MIRGCHSGMSALETFVRIRQYKDRAAEFFELSGRPFSEEVRARYLAIADHYTALADAELRADQLVRKQRLDRMRSEREKSRRLKTTPAVPFPVANDTKFFARRRSAGPAQMAAQAAFPAAKPAP